MCDANLAAVDFQRFGSIFVLHDNRLHQVAGRILDRMDVHLVDGTYELFRHYYAVPPATDGKGLETGAVRGVLFSVLSMLEKGATHLGVATDHVVESFRNDLYPG